ncbi:hypothetical protein K488DRAFT_88717 [Vararia minispora EC-137]|uniref:Uncharacterized protein n=1 Tax=Vararia minispora EC-137 TaxID=1314806 RepID=A0ACB8QCC5_9AGAM|nr:hypothetical protein K488DRAFT_88717 [Vararia minispora EC-137]
MAPEAGPSHSQDSWRNTGSKRQRGGSDVSEQWAQLRSPNEDPLLKVAKRSKQSGTTSTASLSSSVLAGYQIPRHAVPETVTTTVRGEPADHWMLLDGSKPVRLLDNFVIFDTQDGNQLAPLELPDPAAVMLQAVGHAEGYTASEDLNDKDEDEDEEDEDEDDQDMHTQVLLHTTGIEQVWFDHTEWDGPIWIETENAWYVLCRPSRDYEHLYVPFQRRCKIIQTFISLLAHGAQATLGAFINALGELFHQEITPEEVKSVIPLLAGTLEEILPEIANADSLVHVPLINDIIKEYDEHLVLHKAIERLRRVLHLCNVDQDVLKAHNRTHVTPLINQLARRYFDDNFVVVEPPKGAKQEIEEPRGKGSMTDAGVQNDLHQLQGHMVYREHLLSCINNALHDCELLPVTKKTINGNVTKIRLRHISREVIYEIGDTVLFLPEKFNDKDNRLDLENIPDDARLENFFWHDCISKCIEDL